MKFMYSWMASTLSTITSEIFLHNLEQSHINKLKHDFDIVFYARFVD